MPAIEVKSLQKYFGKTKAVDDISFTIEKGEVFGFLGPNGAGKTTTIRCLMDFIRPTAGSASILGLDAQKDAVRLKHKIGYLSGSVRLYHKWTGEDHIKLIRNLNGGADNSDELTERFEFNPKIKVKQLSSGNRQKLGLIMAFMTKPEVLILDEPTLGLDPLLQNTVYELLEEYSQRGTTVFMSSHNLSEVDRVCSRVGIIRHGKMVAMESIRALKEKKMHTVRLHFTQSFNETDFKLENVTVAERLTDGLVLNVRGDINPLLKKIAAYHLRDINITEASLEDIFMEYYEQP